MRLSCLYVGIGTDSTDQAPQNWPSYLDHLRDSESRQAAGVAGGAVRGQEGLGPFKKQMLPAPPQSHQATPSSNVEAGGLQSFQKSFLDGDFEFVS